MPRSYSWLSEKCSPSVWPSQRIGRHLGNAQAAEELDLGDHGLQPVGRVLAAGARPAPVPGPQVEVDRLAGLEGAVAGIALQLHVADLEAVVAQRHRAQHVDLADEVHATKGVAGCSVDLHRRADLLDHAVVHHHDAVGHRQRFFLVVGDHDGGDADVLLQPADLAAQADARLARRAPTAARRAAAGRARVASARASATRCCWPPESCARVLGARGRQAGQRSAVRSRAP